MTWWETYFPDIYRTTKPRFKLVIRTEMYIEIKNQSPALITDVEKHKYLNCKTSLLIFPASFHLYSFHKRAT